MKCRKVMHQQHSNKSPIIASCLAAFFCLFGLPQLPGQTPAPDKKGSKPEEKTEEKNPSPKPVKPIQKPCNGKLVAMHAYSECGPGSKDGEKVWHVVEDDYYDCPPVQKFRVYDYATDQKCDQPAPNPIGTAFQPFSGSGCQNWHDVAPMDIYECENGRWYLNTYQVSICDDDGRRLVTLKDRKDTGKSCDEPKPELKLPVVAATQPAPTAAPGSQTLAPLIQEGKIKYETVGTGETIGHIADLKLQNLTGEPISFTVPPMILESGSKKNQHYACPKSQSITIDPHGSKTVPIDGVCLNRNKPPVGKGVSGDLGINEGNPNIPADPRAHLTARDANKLLRICKAKYDMADKLQRDGLLKDLPYHDPQKQKDIVTQWSTWTDPRICQITGAPPATKDDLKKVVYKQLPSSPSPETKKKIDQGIDKIFEKVELTTEKAKDLEQPDPFAQVDLTGEPAKGATYEVGNNRTDDKKEPEKSPKQKALDKILKNNPKLKDWLDKYKEAKLQKQVAQNAAANRDQALDKYCRESNKNYAEQASAIDKMKAELKPEDAEGKANLKKAEEQLGKLRKELETDFNNTEKGKAANKEMRDTQKDSEKADAAEREAGKNIPKETKEMVSGLQDEIDEED